MDSIYDSLANDEDGIEGTRYDVQKIEPMAPGWQAVYLHHVQETTDGVYYTRPVAALVTVHEVEDRETYPKVRAAVFENDTLVYADQGNVWPETSGSFDPAHGGFAGIIGPGQKPADLYLVRYAIRVRKDIEHANGTVA